MFNRLPSWLLSLVGWLAKNSGFVQDKLNRLVINGAVESTRHRPHPWSTWADYVSWRGLTDRTYSARHLPPLISPKPLPEAAMVARLFQRPGAHRLSDKSTCLFPAFAQYLTDGFIRTDMDDRKRTTTNHEIDLCPLYGRTVAQTDILRLKSEAPGQRGRLKSQMIKGEEYAPFLCQDGVIKPEFSDDPKGTGLDAPLGFSHWTPAQRDHLFAYGGDRANATPFSSMMNTLFLREHNRLAGELEKRNSGWDDERVFQTARNINIVMFIKIVVEDYINHITPLPFPLRADPSIAWKANWNRPNWITAEFSLLYRWHPLMPDSITFPGRTIPIGQFTTSFDLIPETGLAASFTAAASQPAGEIGPLNTATPLLFLETMAINQARGLRMRGYNEYRVAFGEKRVTKFEEISSRPDVLSLLKSLYPSVDDVEFYPGLFAEDRVKNSPLPPLLLTMVAVDAFSQALTNPLLSEHVFNRPDTFTEWGRGEIDRTSTVADVLSRNVPVAPTARIAMTQAGWKAK